MSCSSSGWVESEPAPADIAAIGGTQVIETAALTLAACAGVFFVSLGGSSLFAPARAGRFLLGFANSARKHYAELAVRLLVGAAFVIAAPRMAAPGAFACFGWLLLGTTTFLLLVPWRWHHHFASRAVPKALAFLAPIGVASVAMGALVLWGVFGGNAA